MQDLEQLPLDAAQAESREQGAESPETFAAAPLELTVVVDPDELPQPGKMVVAVIDNEQAVVKRYLVEGKQRWLRPLNGVQIPIDEHVRIVGVVKKIIKAA